MKVLGLGRFENFLWEFIQFSHNDHIKFLVMVSYSNHKNKKIVMANLDKPQFP